jgi:hypothetical protein
MKQVNASKELIHFMILNSILTFEELLLIPNEGFYKMEGFTYHLLTEILEIKKTQTT